jgi:hypothetical protein
LNKIVRDDYYNNVFTIFLLTPEHEDEQDEEAEEAEAAAVTEVEPSKSDGKWKSSERSSRRSTYSDGQSRTPSRSPTPRRRSDDEDTMEAR